MSDSDPFLTPGSHDLESRWEVVLRGDASSAEEVNLRDEIRRSGREEEFEVQAEVSGYIKNHFRPEEVPGSLISHYKELAREESRKKEVHSRRMYWRGFGSALAASLVIFIVTAGLAMWIQQPEPFDDIVSMSRGLWNRTMLEGFQTKNKDVTLGHILGMFEKELRHKPTFQWKRDGQFTLVGGLVRKVPEGKVATLFFRAGDRPFLLSIYRVVDHPNWASLPDRVWMIDTTDFPPTGLWRRDKFVYSLTGYAKVDTLREMTKSFDPKIMASQ